MVSVKFVLVPKEVANLKRREVRVFVTNPGSRIHVHYAPTFDGSRVVLVASGQDDLQDTIESYGKYTDLHYMLHRLSLGDTNVLASRPPIYGDFSGLPSNPVDAINIVHSAERAFGELSKEERSAYNNDFRSWLASRLSGNQASKPSVPNPVKPDIPVKEVSKE